MRYSAFTMIMFEQNIILISGDGIFEHPQEWTSTKSSLVNPIEIIYLYSFSKNNPLPFGLSDRISHTTY